MLRYKVETENLPELQALYKQAPDTTTRHATTTGNKSPVDLQRMAKTLAQAHTAQSHQSIPINPMRSSGNRLTDSVGTNVQYAEAPESGTGSCARPRRRFARRTADM